MQNIISKPLLTICYYAYNDSKHWAPVINELLDLRDNRFRIVLQDNASTDESDEIAAKITDPRFVYRKNKTNIGASPNIIAALSNNDSEYNMLMVARDRVRSHNLLLFLDFLEREKPIYGNVSIWHDKKGISFHNNPIGIASYLKSCNSSHPSGFFWKTSNLNEILKHENIKKFRTFDFIYELISAELSFDFGFTYVECDLIEKSDNRQDVPERLSYYSENVFTEPSKRISQLITYLYQINTLLIDKEDKIQLMKEITKVYCNKCTYGYYLLMKNDFFCHHYHLEKRKVTIKEMKRYLNQAIASLKLEGPEFLEQSTLNQIVKTIKIFKRNFYPYIMTRLLRDKIKTI